MVTVLAAIVVAAILGRNTARARDVLPLGAAVLTVEPVAQRRAIPAGFVGLSFEFPAIEAYAGESPRAVDPVLVQLIRNLAPGSSPVLRIGGDSTDSTWWPVRHLRRPGGVGYALTARWLAVTRALAKATRARLILGINLEAGSRALASAEARALVVGIGRRRVKQLELGNEPELYASFGWYRARDGHLVPGRGPGYRFQAFARDFSSFGAALPSLPLAGPSIGAPRWMGQVQRFVSAEPRLGLVTLHRYPLRRCYVRASSPNYATIGRLLSPSASSGLAAGLAQPVAIARAHRLSLRVDEMNSVACGGVRGVSNTFASALWALDAMFALARVGVVGVNIHTFPRAAYELFKFKHVHGRWRAFVEPEYYGLLMFAQAAPRGSRLLALSGATGPGINAWATRAPNGQTRVVLINDSTASPRVVAVRVPAAAGAATLERLQAPSAAATSGVTLGGRSFSPHTGTGLLSGRSHAVSVPAVAGEYAVTLPAPSAAMLTFR
jgi:hypothetical protein